MGDNSENDKCRAEKEYFINEWIYYWFILCELYLMLTKNYAIQNNSKWAI